MHNKCAVGIPLLTKQVGNAVIIVGVLLLSSLIVVNKTDLKHK